MSAPHNRYPDDPFAPSRMPLAEHLQELAVRMRLALAGVLLVMVGGMTLDATGQALQRPEIGFAFPVLRALTAPAEKEVRAFYLKRYDQIVAKLRARPNSGKRESFAVVLTDTRGDRAEVRAEVDPVELARIAKLGELLGGFKQPVTTLSAPEAMTTYLKVAFGLGFVIASPWVFYQFWAFVAAGLYPHEKRYAYTLLPASVSLFLAGVILCQLVVLPSAVRTLLTFNDWAGYDPDLRLREWIGFAIVLPVVFGVAFQTPVLMAFFTRIGVTTARGYLTYWRHSALGMAVFAAVITPTQDVITWGYLFVPLLSLYLVGVGVCRLVEPGRRPAVPSV